MYNAKRLHSSLDYVPPDEFEVEYLRCSWSDGMDSLGALQLFSCQFDCQLTVEGRLAAGRTALQGERREREGGG